MDARTPVKPIKRCVITHDNLPTHFPIWPTIVIALIISQINFNAWWKYILLGITIVLVIFAWIYAIGKRFVEVETEVVFLSSVENQFEPDKKFYTSSKIDERSMRDLYADIKKRGKYGKGQ